MADLNIISVSTINARTTGAELTNTSANVLINTYGNSKTIKVNNIIVTNKSGNTVASYLNFEDYSTTNTYPILHNLEVPTRSTVEVLSKPLYLEEGDRLTGQVLGSAGGNVDSGNLIMILSYEELS
jgi:flagellar biosynthesis/type III secretory pathway ATPase